MQYFNEIKKNDYFMSHLEKWYNNREQNINCPRSTNEFSDNNLYAQLYYMFDYVQSVDNMSVSIKKVPHGGVFVVEILNEDGKTVSKGLSHTKETADQLAIINYIQRYY